jgi:hypothetical protein
LGIWTKHIDGLWYHIPRMIFWLQQHNFNPWITPVYAQIGLPVGGDVILGQKIFLGHGWYGIGFITSIFSLGAITTVYLIALDFKLTRWQAVMSAILFGSFPAIGLRIWSVNTDILAAFPVLASYVSMRKIKDFRFAITIFVLLNAIAIACKPTIVPLLLVFCCVTLWRCKARFSELKTFAMPIAAVIISLLLVYSSYYPVYVGFSDFLGGDYSKAHKSATIAEFSHAIAMHTGHWLLEPLGYLTPFNEHLVKGIAKKFYNMLGANFEALPEMWKPWPAQDIGYTGLASLLIFPALIAGLPRSAKIPSIVFFLLSYIPLCGMIIAQPYFSRYNVVILSGYALVWGGTRIFSKGYGRWILLCIVMLNVCALLGVVSARFYVDQKIKSKPGGQYDYISAIDREKIATSLNGQPLLVITDNTLDALLVGPDIDYHLSYIICPEDGDWQKELQKASIRSNWLALVHNGEQTMRAGSEWKRPGSHACSEFVSIQRINNSLRQTGWKLYKSSNNLTLWNIGK